ncbi:rod shape-determining protein MreC [Enterovibrio makurazakiensis]|uniref:Cell shape-determining protein MreC n=1 Tax=Enterovibrio gelatinilyticus TaxID=2899819 RepID=A0ABT5QVL5_9GAMM|nr:rod shape-determining protein MreC [Enterovibrio sp. ZSDZ42]MDD1792047.1 rod shape-determining protein MreC [Enterovibrio sp. ZSDZ42]
MKPMFGRGPSLQLRLFFALLISASLMLADSRLGAFTNFRYVLNSVVAPLQYASNVPRDLLDSLFRQFSSHQQLLIDNSQLKEEVLMLRSSQLLFDQMEQENQRLRELLGSPFVRDERKMVAEVMAVDSDPYKHQVMIDKGRTNGVYEGQPVINERGIVGQVSYVGAHNSRVLLITDPTHAIPVQVVRNDVRVIAAGRGQTDNIQLENIPSSADIEPGDMLVTSGLGGVFPEGYPVAKVTSFSFDNRRPFAQVDSKPEVQFDRLRYLLLVWPSNVEKQLEQQKAEAMLDDEMDPLTPEIETQTPDVEAQKPDTDEQPKPDAQKEITNG